MTPSSQEDQFAELVRLRRLFHRNPETGFAEFWTTARICEYLEPMNCSLMFGKDLQAALVEPERMEAQLNTKAYDQCLQKYPDDPWIPRFEGIPGVVVLFKGKKKGPRFGFRFDMDGLPIQEACAETHLPFKNGFASDTGNMHACGHDGHITLGLGLASLLSKNLEELSGEFYLLFQPGEEVLMGGRLYSKLGFIKDLDYFFSAHLGMSGPGMTSCGVSFFADKRLRVVFKGTSAHAGGAPHAGRNALLAACTAVNGLYGISRHSGGSSRINIGEFKSDNVVNIIPDHAEFELDLRAQTNPVMEYLLGRAENIIKGAALMQGVTHDIRFEAETETAPNSGEMVSEVRKACLDIGMKKEQILDRLQISGSEDATFIMNEVLRNGGKTTYIGIGSPSKGTHHNENFDIHEEDLPRGVNLLFQLAQNLSRTC
ncbi:MAG: amidohydrolase [Proteobacteria bacterium]|nr:amidohydrolase [Pseudomonadota bacterium]MBU4471894.1 amidohydrolase [Pseudomonadota bacterium]MCG2752830.1 amidohydrolase [Desulfobacteraceae bacterium]